MGNACPVADPKAASFSRESLELEDARMPAGSLIICRSNSDSCPLSARFFDFDEEGSTEYLQTGALVEGDMQLDADKCSSDRVWTNSCGGLERSQKFEAPSDCYQPVPPTKSREDSGPSEASVSRDWWLRFDRGEEVFLHLYDLTETLGHVNAVALDFLGVGGALHAGVEIFIREWSYGTSGVSSTSPRNHPCYKFRKTVRMGRTYLPESEIAHLIEEMKRDWKGTDYDLFSRNCGTFCNTLCLRLGVGSVPAWVTRLAEVGARLDRLNAVRRVGQMLSRSGLLSSPVGKTSEGVLENPSDDEEEAAQLRILEDRHEHEAFLRRCALALVPDQAGVPQVVLSQLGKQPQVPGVWLPAPRCDAFRVKASQGQAGVIWKEVPVHKRRRPDESAAIQVPAACGYVGAVARGGG